MAQVACGIDIGGSGVKGALVDLETGEYIGDQVRIPTPTPATPDAVAAVCREVIDQLGVKDRRSDPAFTFPAPVFDGVIPYMANLDQRGSTVDVDELMERYPGPLRRRTERRGRCGHRRGRLRRSQGPRRRHCVYDPGHRNRLGDHRQRHSPHQHRARHLEIDGTDAEKNASSGQKTLQGLNWEQWAQRLQRYYSHVEFLLNPDLFVVGGGVSENHEKFMPLLDLKTPMIPAKLLNTAGIVGAAYYAAQHSA